MPNTIGYEPSWVMSSVRVINSPLMVRFAVQACVIAPEAMGRLHVKVLDWAVFVGLTCFDEQMLSR